MGLDRFGSIWIGLFRFGYCLDMFEYVGPSRVCAPVQRSGH
jgi:hypothetical protein